MTNEPIQATSAGGIIYHNNQILTLFIKTHNEIVFPKGTVEPGESTEDAAIREVLEETGYHAYIDSPLGNISHAFTNDDGKLCQKTVHYFLMRLNDENEIPDPDRELHEVDEQMENLWLDLNTAMGKLTHDNSKQMLANALKVLKPVLSA